jgi:hypothetical protein
MEWILREARIVADGAKLLTSWWPGREGVEDRYIFSFEVLGFELRTYTLSHCTSA